MVTGKDPSDTKLYNDALSGAGDRYAGTIFSEIKETEQRRERERQANAAKIAAIANIAQATEYYKQMGVQLSALTTASTEMGEQVNIVQQELGSRIDVLEAKIAEKREELKTLQDKVAAGTATPAEIEQAEKLEIHLQGQGKLVEAYRQESKILSGKYDTHKADLEQAQAKYDSIQAKIDAASDSDTASIEALKVELQGAQDAIDKAQTSLDQVEAQVAQAQLSLELTSSMYEAGADNTAYMNYSVPQLQAQADLAAAFVSARADGTLTAAEQQNLGALFAQTGLDPADASVIGGFQQFSGAVKDGTYHVEGANGQILKGDQAYKYLLASFASLKKMQPPIQASTNDIVAMFDDRITALNSSADMQHAPDTMGPPVPGVSAANELANIYAEKRDELTAKYELYDVKVAQAQEALDNLSAQGASPEELLAAQNTLNAATSARDDVVTEAQQALETLDKTAGLSSELSTECSTVEYGKEQFAMVQELKATGDITAANAAAAGDSVRAIDVSHLKLPNIEVIGSSNAETDTVWTAEETLTLDPDAEFLRIGGLIENKIENGEITLAQIEQAAGPNASPELMAKIEATLERAGIKILRPDENTPNPTNSIFVDKLEPGAKMASYQYLGATAPANSIQLPTQAYGTAAPANYASFAGGPEFAKYNPVDGPTPSYAVPTMNKAPESLTFAEAKPAGQAAPGASGGLTPAELLEMRFAEQERAAGLGPSGSGGAGGGAGVA